MITFPRNLLWLSIVDAYKVSRDLSNVKLDKLFCEPKLHKQVNFGHKKTNITLVAKEKSKKKKLSSKSQEIKS